MNKDRDLNLNRLSFGEKLKKIDNSFIRYLFFNCMSWFFFLIVLSVIAFFHFALDHRISSVVAWVQDKQWGLILFCRISSLFVVSYLILFFKGGHNFSSFKEDLRLKSEVTSILTFWFLYFSFMFLFFREDIFFHDFFGNRSSFIAISSLYLIDGLFFYITEKKQSSSEITYKDILNSTLVGLAFYLFAKALQVKQDNNVFCFYFFSLSHLMICSRKENLLVSLLFYLIIVLPFFALWVYSGEQLTISGNGPLAYLFPPYILSIFYLKRKSCSEKSKFALDAT